MSYDEIRATRLKVTVELLDEFFSLSESWCLDIDEQRQLLGREAIDKLLNRIDQRATLLLGDQAIKRLVLLTGISKDIKILFPHLKSNIYIRSRDKFFENQSPLEIILNDPDDGLPRVKAYLTGTSMGAFG